MTVAAASAAKVRFIVWMVTCSLLLSVGTSSGTSIGGISPQISVAAGTGLDSVHYTKAGIALAIDVLILAKDAAPPFSSDVYVGILMPNGQSVSLLGDFHLPVSEPVLVTGAPLPFLTNATLVEDTGGRLVVRNFAAGGPEGWHVVYGLIVPAGQDPGNPRNWVSSFFFPLLVTPAANP